MPIIWPLTASCYHVRKWLIKAPTHGKDSPRLLKTRPSWQVLENRRQAGSTTADCHTRKTVTIYLLGDVSHSSDPSGDSVAPAPPHPGGCSGNNIETLRSRRRTCHTAAIVYDAWDGPPLRLNMFSLDDSFRRDGNWQNRSKSIHTAPIV